MNFARTTALGLAVFTFGACSYPDFQYASGSSASGTSATSSTAGSTGAGGLGSPSTSSSSSSGSGAGGGDAGVVCMPAGHPGTCEYLPSKPCGCGGTTKCSVIDEATGEADCVTIGENPLVAWSRCNSDADCGAGTWCDHYTETCRRICNGVSDCAPNAQCVPAKQKDNKTEIPGLKVCTAHCNPETVAPCGPSVTCEYNLSLSEFDCYASGNLTEGVDCVVAADCEPGLLCVTLNGKTTCEPWCHPPDSMKVNAKCPAGIDVCYPLAQKAVLNGIEYGVCGP